MNRFNTKPAFRRSYFWWQGITGYIDPYPMGTESNSSPCLVANEPTWHECVWKLGNQTPTCGKWQWSFTTKIGDPLVFFKHAHMALRHQWLYPIPALVKTVVESFVDRSGFPAHHVIFALQACDLYWFCQQTCFLDVFSAYHFCRLVELGKYVCLRRLRINFTQNGSHNLQHGWIKEGFPRQF